MDLKTYVNALNAYITASPPNLDNEDSVLGILYEAYSETSAMFVIATILKVKTASLALIHENYITGQKAEDVTEGKKALFRVAADALIAK